MRLETLKKEIWEVIKKSAQKDLTTKGYTFIPQTEENIKEFSEAVADDTIIVLEPVIQNLLNQERAEIREMIKKMKRPTLKKLRKAIKRASEDNTYMNGYHTALEEILKHLK